MLAMEVIDPNRRYQDRDNYNWIRDAEKNQLVVGTQARFSTKTVWGRVNIAPKFNELVREGKIGPVMIGRDHHDVSGTDLHSVKLLILKMDLMSLGDMAGQCYVGTQLAV